MGPGARVDKILRMGLLVRREMAGARKLVVRPKPMGPPSGFSYDNVQELLDRLDGVLRR
jgi:hypothetical protein